MHKKCILVTNSKLFTYFIALVRMYVTRNSNFIWGIGEMVDTADHGDP